MMRQPEKQVVFTFHTTAGAMAMERFCKQRELPGRLIPVPRSLSASCGIAWTMPPKDAEKLQIPDELEVAGRYEIDL